MEQYIQALAKKENVKAGKVTVGFGPDKETIYLIDCFENVYIDLCENHKLLGRASKPWYIGLNRYLREATFGKNKLLILTREDFSVLPLSQTD